MATFRAVRDDIEPLIERLGELDRAYVDLDTDGRNGRYYEVREQYRELVAAGGAADLDLAALLIFLNKTCFNGLYRVNRRGQFNVPHGRYARPRILDEPGLGAASDALATAELRSVDFEEACEEALARATSSTWTHRSTRSRTRRASRHTRARTSTATTSSG